MNLNKTTSTGALLLAGVISLFQACKKKESTPTPSSPPVNETELITTVKVLLTDTANTNDMHQYYFYDIDGIGGNPPSILDTIDLKAGRVYQAEITLLDETKNPADSISNQVLKEGADHLFVFGKNGVNVSFAITDKDKNNLPIGLSSYWTTGTATSGTGSVTVTLRHQPGVKNGTATPGETDVQVVYPCRVR